MLHRGLYPMADVGGAGNVITGKPILGLHQPRYQSMLVISSEYQVCFTRPKPGWWRRLWYWLLLGWEWRDL